MHVALAGSRMASFTARIAAELAEDEIPATCPHVVTADRLHLPSRTRCCHECSPEPGEDPDAAPGPCASCEAPGSCRWITWLDQDSHVLVTARVCELCATDGNVPVSLN